MGPSKDYMNSPQMGPPKISSSIDSSKIMVIGLVSLVAAIIILMAAGQDPWDLLFIDPLINVLIIFDNIFFNQFGIAIVAFTVLMRIVTLPLTVKQFKSSLAMQSIQPKMQEVQKKYKDPKRRQEETIKLYREAGVNPAGCLLPMLVQLPIWIALYRALIIMLGGTPESQVGLSGHLYPWDYVSTSVPLEQSFLWLDLGQSDSTFALPILVGITTYIQQKLTTSSATNVTAQQQQMTAMMTWMMPMMFVWITLSVPSGLGVYWVISNLASLLVSIFVYGRKFDWRVLIPLPRAQQPKKKERQADISPELDTSDEVIEVDSTSIEDQEEDERSVNNGKKRRRRRGKRKNN